MRLKPRLPRLKGRSWLRGLRNLGILAIFFLVGVNFGNGRIDLTPSSSVAGQLPSRLDYTEVNQLYQSLKETYDGQLSQQQLEDGLKHELATSTKDPYTVYFTAKEAKDFSDQINNSFSGIGAQLGQDKDGNLEVIAPIDGLPADRAGIQAKDIITTVNKESTSDMSVDEAVSKIRGPAGTKVKLQIVRDRAQALDFNITREDIHLPSVKTKLLDGNIGHIQISNFSGDTTELITKTAKDFKAQNVRGIILDMRDNPGGLLPQAINVSSVWLPHGKKVLDTKKGSKIVESDYSVGDPILNGIPTVVLINGGSASASEIVAGALRDHKAAYLIGEKTYGKGVVQELINFGDGSQLKVTVASWYRPNGQNINKKGIQPDKTVKITDAEAKAISDAASEADKQAQDPQLKAAHVYLNR